MSVKLPLTEAERTALRKEKIKVNDVANLKPETLRKRLNISLDRAKNLVAHAAFQRIPSIGPKLSASIIELGYFSLEDLKDKDGRELTDEFEQLCSFWVDPCVEDSFRCVVYHASHPGSDKNWWDFTEKRKTDRKQYGYPKDRPKTAWYETQR